MTKPSKNHPFFIGYLPMPAALKRLYFPLSILVIVACGFAGYYLAAAQKSVGGGFWNTAETVTMRGVLTLSPYPVLHRVADGGGVESVLLVRQGKHGADAAVQPAAEFDGAAVTATGYEIRRGGWVMLEVAGDDSLVATGAVENVNVPVEIPAIRDLGEITVSGEIADSKCFLGVMKPGAGAVHKACAEVCLLGGIPPLLVAADAAGEKFGYLLADANGNSSARFLAQYAAETVTITGNLRQLGDLLFIAAAGDEIRRQ